MIYRDLGVFGFVEGLFFVVTLGVGLLYAWKKGALEWEWRSRTGGTRLQRVSLA